jgi:hypothetical protein
MDDAYINSTAKLIAGLHASWAHTLSTHVETSIGDGLSFPVYK